MEFREFRVETDSMGGINVPTDRYWGAQTQRSLENFKIGGQRFAPSVIRAFGIVKKAAALTNLKLGKLDETKASAARNPSIPTTTSIVRNPRTTCSRRSCTSRPRPRFTRSCSPPSLA
jgi:hypothetical protein